MNRPLLVLLGLVVLVGCAGNPPRHPEYARTAPFPELTPPANNGAIFQSGYEVALFEDIKARRVGDVLTIRLVERTQASKKASTNVSKTNQIDFQNPTLFGMPLHAGKYNLQTEVDTSQEFAGEGDSSQSNTLSGDITVTVAEVLSNGYLLVKGEKLLTLNQGDEFIRLSGIVRPTDIAPDNSVLSTRVADVEITYAGRGAVADANTTGWLSRFFLSVLWPF